MSKQIRHLRTHRKGPKTGTKYSAGKKIPPPFQQALKRSKRALTSKLTKKDLEYLRKTANQLTKKTFPPIKGFLIPALIIADEKNSKRWEWHLNNLTQNKITLPIPQIKFLSMPEPNTLKMLRNMTNTIKEEGHYGSQAAELLVEWFAWGFGIKDINTFRLSEKVHQKLQEQFKLELMLQNPADYFARLFEESGHAGGPGWFATPMNVTEMITQMIFPTTKPWEVINEPAIGTGSMVLPASNYSLNITGQDISPLMILTAKVNFTLYVPWAIVPYPEQMLEKLKEAA